MTDIVHKSADTYLAQNLDAEIKAAQVFIKSGLLPSSITKASQVIVISETARALNIPRVMGLSSISVVKGRPTMEAQLMRALFNRQYPDAMFKVLVETDKKCTIEIGKKDQPLQQFSFTWEMATRAGLVTKDNWKKYPEAMLLARATAKAIRIVAPEVLMGVIYSAEELDPDAEVTEEGTVEVVNMGEVEIVPDEEEVEVIEGEIIDVEEEEVGKPEGMSPLTEGQIKQLERFRKSHITSDEERLGIDETIVSADKDKATKILDHFFRKEVILRWWEGKELAIQMLDEANAGIPKEDILKAIKEAVRNELVPLRLNDIMLKTDARIERKGDKWVVSNK